ncbi:DUF3017 domain-containing protein [Nocardioides speluncae]|uniref:DUF3017 domain-containing protein n=1 Tax=Nocardioides speluncae TaxID=2670337 RepID=UPI00137B2D8C|nr:DUF3017 domain-containing protein [Nocardioides speluncae]
MSSLSESLPAEPPPIPEGQPEGVSLGKPVDQPVISPYGDGIPEVAPTPSERRYPSTLGGVVYIGVLIATLAGLGITATGAWRQGVVWIGCAMLAAAAARGVLSDDNAGMLRVRRKLLDIFLLIFAGVLLIFLALTIPDQS